MYGLDLFSGIGGLTLALQPWVRPVAYCEIDDYCRRVLLSRMGDGLLPRAGIWDDVRTLRGKALGQIDIVYGGFPCQDISVAGRGRGLAGERSGLFFEIVRLIGEIKPQFVFLENVPAIRTRGGDVAIKELARLGYDCRWDIISAAEVGAPHLRKRWFLLANSLCNGRGTDSRRDRLSPEPKVLQQADGETRSNNPAPMGGNVAHAESEQGRGLQPAGFSADVGTGSDRSDVTDTSGNGRQQRRAESNQPRETGRIAGSNWWAVEPNVGRVANGISKRVDRLRGLGNAVVPQQAREAFKRLCGL